MFKLQIASQTRVFFQHKRVEEAALNAQQSTSFSAATTPPPPPNNKNPRERPGPEAEHCLSRLQEFKSVKSTGPFPSPSLAAACVLSITVNITEQEVEGWEEVKHKPAAQCTCLAAACSDILGHGDLVERTDAH